MAKPSLNPAAYFSCDAHALPVPHHADHVALFLFCVKAELNLFCASLISRIGVEDDDYSNKNQWRGICN